MTIFHINAILGEPWATKNAFPGSSPTRLSDPDNEVWGASRDNKNGQTPVKPLVANEFLNHLNFPSSCSNEKQSFWPVGKYAAI